ncbi:MAG: ATP-binding protein [Clostridiales bacterium]|nr:ATP-binding protein [Clostridiales bacterium]
MSKYMNRLVDQALANELEAFGAVYITGPKWCGKTTTGMQLAKSHLFLQDPDNRQQYLNMAALEPSRLLQGDNPRLIDEWQDAPQLWDAVRFEVDKRSQEGLFILTGSTTVDQRRLAHTGTGRITRLSMRTMSLFESGFSSGSVRLHALFEGEDISAKSDHTISDIAEQIVRGGWPGTIHKSYEAAKRQIAGYCRSILETEISSPDGVNRDPEKVAAVLKSYSRHTSTSATIMTIVKDVSEYFSPLSRNTAADYIAALEKIYVVEDLKAWSPRLRSKTAIATSPTRHFADPAIAAFFLDAGASDLMNDLETFGLLFESLVIRDLRIYAESLGGKVYHYRDHSGLEADAIVHLPGGTWGAFEVKLGEAWVEKAAENLLRLKERIDTEKTKAPSFLAVICASGYAYRRKDGVYVLPIDCLRN